MRLAQLDDVHARDLLETALRLNLYNAPRSHRTGPSVRGGGRLRQRGKAAAAGVGRGSHVSAALDPGQLLPSPRQSAAFWTWARRAAEMPSADITPLFQLCWRVTPDAAVIAKTGLTGDPDTVRQYLSFLLAKDQLRAVVDVAPRLVQAGNVQTDRALLLSVVNRLITANDGLAAAASGACCWNSTGWLPTPRCRTMRPSRGSIPVAFDWVLPVYEGLHSWPGSSGFGSGVSGRSRRTV